MLRRDLLLAGAALAAPTRAADRIRIAMIGGGHSHAFEKAKVLKASAEWDLAGIAEDSPQIAARFEQFGVRRLSRDAILRDSTIPVVAIESEVKAHESDALAALRAGKHVHIEKPIAHTSKGLAAIAAEARRGKRLVQSGHMWRYNPGFQKILEAASSGWLGDIYLVRGMMNILIPAETRPEWAIFKGGQMFEQGSHLLDPMLRILGKPVRVQSILRRHGKYNDTLADNTVALLEFPNALGIVQSSTLQPSANLHRTFEVQGTNGTAVLRPIEQPVVDVDLAKAAGPYKAGRQRLELPKYERYAADFIDLAAAVRDSKPLVVSLDHEVAVHELLLRVCDMR